MARVLLLLAALVPACVGAFAGLAPASLLAAKGVLAVEPAALAMTRTVGVALSGVAGLNFACRDLGPSVTRRRLLAANALLQLLLLPLDPYACAVGAFSGVGSYLPNTLLHVGLALAFGLAWTRERAVPCLTAPGRETAAAKG
jgi:hypothetical protein